MKESISELQSAIRRVRPHLLLHQHHPSTTTPSTQQQQQTQSQSTVDNSNDTDNNNEVFAARNELQLEAASELINAVATFVWKLDCLWDDHSRTHQEQQYDDNRMTIGNDATNDNDARLTSPQHDDEPYSEWNADAKALIREGYGMISAVSRPSSSSLDDIHNYSINDEEQRQHKETMRTLARSSILELLTSVSTSSCRHFLLAFLPHFTPLAVGEGELSTTNTTVGGGKQALTENTNENQDPAVISQLLEAFQSLIQIDATTLVPFLSTLSNLFASVSWEEERYDGLDTNMSDDDGADDDHYADNPRKECFRICIASMSSISEHDLPSLLKSLFTLVRSAEEGRLAMESVRKECNSAFSAATTAIPDPSILGLAPKDDGDLSINDHHNISNNNYLVLFIGNVIIQSLLSDELYGSKHLAKGFLDEVRHSLHIQTQLQYEAAQTSSTSDIGKSLNCLTTLDAIVLIALHSHAEYQSLVESIIESLTTNQAMLFFGLIQPLIESWKPAKNDWNGTHQASSLLYGQLSSSLISLLFYMLMVSTMTVPSQGGDSQFTLVNGLLSVHYAEVTATSTTEIRECNMNYAVTCCRVISNLYSNIDPQKQQQVVNSLLSMVTDSFVRSSAASTIGKKTTSSEGGTQEDKGYMGSLLAASCAACRTILLISNKHATNLSQMKGTVMDRLLLLASMSASISPQQDGGKTDDAVISYHLFDMNCAIYISLLQDNEQLRYNDSDRETNAPINGNSATELLILCQKFLFATDYLSSEGTSNPEHRVICGIILASRLLRCKFILRSERGNIWNWMMSVITPAPTTTAPIQALNPVVAQWGLSFLNFASSPIADNSFHPEMTEFVDANSVCGHSDVFNQVNKMLATAAVIQMEDSLLIPLRQESSNENITFLAYSHIPQKKKTSETNSMVISSPYFLYGKRFEDPGEPKPSLSAIDQVAEYVYDLVDRYLELGRIRSSGALSFTSSWNPRGWLLAKIQLPCCLSQPTMKVLGMKNNSLELEHEPSANAHVNPESWKLLFSPTVSNAAIVRSLIEFLSCIVVSISVSSAVLKHAHDHFSQEEIQLTEMGDSDSDDAQKKRKKKQKQVEALRKLLQFQVNKVVSMQRVCRNIYQLLNGLHFAACKQRLSIGPEKPPSAHNNGILHDRRRIPLAEIQSLVTAAESFLNSRMNKFDSSIMWSCILDDVDDAFLLETMTKTSSIDEQLLSRQQQIIHFRIHILRYLQHNLTSNTKQKRLHGQAWGNNTPATFNDLSLLGISRVFQLLMSLTPCLSSNFSESTSEEGRLYLSALYKILLAAFSSAASNKRVGPTMIDNALIDVVPNKRRSKATKLDPRDDRNLQLDNLMRKCAATKDAEDDIPTETDVTAVVVKLKESLLQQRKKCEDASISCYIMDLISILVISDESSRGAMADITWKNIHSVYRISSSSVTHLPYMLFEISHIISDVTKNENCDAERAAVVKDTFSHLLRLSNTLLKTKDLHAKAFYHNLLAHYSSLLIEHVSQSQCLTEIYTALETTIALSSPSKSLPGLNQKNLPPVFELLLHMNALSLSLAKPFSSKKHRPLNADKKLGPYCEIIWPIEMFGKLLLLFKTHSFSQRVFFNVVKHSLLMIKLCDYQLQYCIDWRNSQNVSLVATGSQDYAAVEMLQPLIDCIASACIGDITSFCRTIRKELSDSNYKNTKSIAGLIFRIQGIKDTLKSICQSHSLKLPQKFAPSDAAASNKRNIADDTAPEKKRRRSLSPQKSNNSRLSANASVLEQLPTPTPERSYITKPSSESDDSDMSENYSFADSDDDSFGAVGDWAA